MDSPVGTIQTIQEADDERRITVLIDVTAACPRCAAGKGCGAGIFNGLERTQTIRAIADDQMTLVVGDKVQLRLARASLLTAASVAYGVPLLGALLAAGLAYSLSLSDAAAALVALSGLAAGVLLGQWRLAGPDCLGRFVPQIAKRL